MQRDYIRRFGATIRHRISGFQANAMAAWAVPEADVDRVGAQMAAVWVVTHCYERQISGEWPITFLPLFTVGPRKNVERLPDERRRQPA